MATLAALRSLPETESLYVFNGQNAPALTVGKRYGTTLRFQYIEDGLDAYLPVNLLPVPTWHRKLHLIAFRWNHPHLIDMTEALPFSGWHALFPDATRLRVGTDRIATIPAESLRWAVALAERAIPELPIPERITHLYMLDLQPKGQNLQALLFALGAWATDVRRNSPRATLAVKTHPRETNGDCHGALAEIDGVRVLPRRIPAELLTSYFAPDVRIRCDLTTFIMTSSILLPQRSVELKPTVAVDAAAMLHRWDETINQIRVNAI